MLLEHELYLWFGHGCYGDRLLLEHDRDSGLGMDALVTVRSWNTDVFMVLSWMLWWPHALGTRTLSMVWAWMLWRPIALGTRTLFWFGHGCYGDRKLLEHDRDSGLGMDALVTVCSWNTNVIYGLGMNALVMVTICSWNTNVIYGLGMSALVMVTICSWNTNGIMVWAWTLDVTTCWQSARTC